MTAAVQQRQHVDAVGCHRLFSGLIAMFVFGILRTATGGIHTLLFITYFNHNILTNMFRPLFLPSSGRSSYYKSTVVVNCVTNILPRC